MAQAVWPGAFEKLSEAFRAVTRNKVGFAVVAVLSALPSAVLLFVAPPVTLGSI
jgi:hypothetical protein